MVENMLYRSPVLLSRLAMIGIGLDGFLGAADVLLGIALVAAPGFEIPLDGGTSLSIWFVAIGLISLAKFPVYTFAVVTFLMWLYRCYTNLPPLRSDNMEFSPGWAVGWWFVPFANLVKPFQAVRTLWSESDPDFDPNHGFLSHVQAGAPGFMALWWGAWLLSNITANIAGRLVDPDSSTGLEAGAYAYLIAGALTFVAALLAVKVISVITDRQEERFANIGRAAMNTPPPPPTFSGPGEERNFGTGE